MGRVKDLLPDDWEGYEDYDNEPECDHADFDMDWDGRARCHCGHSWYLTAEEMEVHRRWEQEYSQRLELQHRRDNAWFRRLGRWIRPLISRRPSADDMPF